MTVKEMQTCASETLDYFLEVMPDTPFTAEDIVIEFAPKSKMAERYRELAAIYKPTMWLNASRERELNSTIAGNALIGKNKSAVLMRADRRYTPPHLRHDVFHELAHIFCGKLENSEGFVDVYGDGTTGPGIPDNKIYDGMINAGYSVWSEFIAEYYTQKHTEPKRKLAEMTRTMYSFLSEVTHQNQFHAKSPFAYACSYFLNAEDAAEELASLSEEHSDTNEGTTFYICLNALYNQVQKDKPWEITEDFIHDIGSKYLMYFSAKFTDQLMPR